MNLHINSDKKKIDTQPQDVVSFINSILSKAMEAGASDVHFEPMADEIVIKFRLDGILEVVERLPRVYRCKAVQLLAVWMKKNEY